jgi:SEC-C motif
MNHFLSDRTVTVRSLPARRATFVCRETGASIEANVRRNGACPCGSGRKFKRCCLAGTAHRPEVEQPEERS